MSAVSADVAMRLTVNGGHSGRTLRVSTWRGLVIAGLIV